MPVGLGPAVLVGAPLPKGPELGKEFPPVDPNAGNMLSMILGPPGLPPGGEPKDGKRFMGIIGLCCMELACCLIAEKMLGICCGCGCC